MLAPILAFAGVAAVQAGPLRARQATSAISSAVSSVVGAPSSVASSAASAASSVVGSATSSASSAVETASSAASSGVESASSAASSAASSSAPTTGNESFPLYPCPTGFLLTYVELNQTVPLPVTQVTQQFGEWANSSYFPNVTASEGGNEVGATHTINLQGVDLIETLVNASMAEDSGAARWTWNLTNGPVSAMGVSLSNYSTVLSIYDPTFDQTGTIGNETTLLTYTNFCANSQAQGMQLVSALAGLELGTFAASLGGAAPGGQPAPSSVSMSAGMMTSSVASSAEMATSMVSSSAAAATSSAGSAASSAGSAASSGAAGVTSSIAAGVSSAVSAALPSSSA